MKAVDAVFTTPPVECGWIYRKLMGASTKWSILLILLWHEKAPLLFFINRRARILQKALCGKILYKRSTDGKKGRTLATQTAEQYIR